ncbi:unnamed protein product, partial [Prunus brigantina]
NFNSLHFLQTDHLFSLTKKYHIFSLSLSLSLLFFGFWLLLSLCHSLSPPPFSLFSSKKKLLSSLEPLELEESCGSDFSFGWFRLIGRLNLGVFLCSFFVGADLVLLL